MLVALPYVAGSILFGASCSLFMPALPSQNVTICLIVCALFSLCLHTKHTIYLLSTTILGFAILSFHANLHLSHMLPKDLEGHKITIVGTISSVVENYKKPNATFEFKISKVDNNSSGWKLPARVQLSARNLRGLAPGDTWRLNVKFRRPRNYANVGSFDLERYFFQRRIVATGYVVDSQENIKLASNSFITPINTIRQRLYAFLHTNLRDARFKSIISSLLLGVRSNISNDDYAVLQTTGTIHLLAISGLHLGILAAIVFTILSKAWLLMPKPIAIVSAPSLCAIIAFIVCVCYALIVGLSIATERAIIMLGVYLFGIILRRKVSSWNTYSLALLLVILWDPLAILSFGFWFSFAAVGLLLYANQYKGQPVNAYQKVYNWLHPQIVLSIGLLPCSLLFFAKAAGVGTFANFIAIPWIGFVVLPLGMLALVIIPLIPELSIILLEMVDKCLLCLWPVLRKMADFPMYTWTLPDKHVTIIMSSAIIGILWLLAPRGIPGRWFGIVALIPLFFNVPSQIPINQADFTMLDVGQGLAVVVRTKNHVLVYDTGAKLNADSDMGAKVVVPYLESIGVKKIDVLMISHGDNDHAGGAQSILRKFDTKSIVTSDVGIFQQPVTQCVAGQYWEWDGVRFEVLHPTDGANYKKRNNYSCVLMIQAGDNKALLTGDIEKQAEYELLDIYGKELQADVLLVPHHGSKTSSSSSFIQTVRPKYALIPVGYKNRYGHPKDEVLKRYMQEKINILRTEQDGAISVRLGGDLMPGTYRSSHKRFWLD